MQFHNLTLSNNAKIKKSLHGEGGVGSFLKYTVSSKKIDIQIQTLLGLNATETV